MSHTMPHPKLKIFSKYDFVKNFTLASIGNTEDQKIREQKEREAAVIADAIEETQDNMLESLITKEDLKNHKQDLEKDLKILEYKLIIKTGILIAVIIGFAPKLWQFFNFSGF